MPVAILRLPMEKSPSLIVRHQQRTLCPNPGCLNHSGTRDVGRLFQLRVLYRTHHHPFMVSGTQEHGRRSLTYMQTSSVFDTQLSGMDPRPAERPFTSRVVVPPMLSTLQARPDLCSGSPMRNTPTTASNAEPVSLESAFTVAAAPCEYPSRIKHSLGLD